MAIQRRTVIKQFKQYREEVIEYFDPCLTLLEDEYDYDVVVSYMFSRLENAHREILYYGIVVLHDVSTKLASKSIDLHDLTRKDFKEKFSKVYGFDIPKSLSKKIESAFGEPVTNCIDETTSRNLMFLRVNPTCDPVLSGLGPVNQTLHGLFKT